MNDIRPGFWEHNTYSADATPVELIADLWRINKIPTQISGVKTAQLRRDMKLKKSITNSK